MKKIWLGLVLISALSMPVSATAADGTALGVGTGAVAGALVGGPLGAVVGAVAGGVIGANSDAIRPSMRRRVRVAHRRRSATAGARQRTHLAKRAALSPNPVRPVAATSATRPSASDPGTLRKAETTGSAGAAWKDPR